MTQDDYEEFSGMVGAITELYGRAASEFAITIWWGALRQYDLAAVRQAFDRHVRNPDTGQFAPKPADLIRMMGGTTQDSALGPASSRWAAPWSACRRRAPQQVAARPWCPTGLATGRRPGR